MTSRGHVGIRVHGLFVGGLQWRTSGSSVRGMNEWWKVASEVSESRIGDIGKGLSVTHLC